MSITEQIDELLYECANQPKGSLKISLAKQAIALADQINDLDRGYAAREELISCSAFRGRPDLSIPAFAWCLAQADANPNRFDLRHLLWMYKWIVAACSECPGISLAQFDELLADLGRRFQAAGYSSRVYYQRKAAGYAVMGHLSEAALAYQEWPLQARDTVSDCHACDINESVIVLTHLGRLEDAFEYAEPILSGRKRCAEVPHLTYAVLLLPALRLNKLAEAQEFHRLGYQRIAQNPNFVKEHGIHIVYLSVIGNLKRAVILLERHLPMALKSSIPLNQLHFYAACHLLTQQLICAGRHSIKARLPQDFALWQADGCYDLDGLQAWFNQQAIALAEQFDQRNRNTYYSDYVAETLALAEELSMVTMQ